MKNKRNIIISLLSIGIISTMIGCTSNKTSVKKDNNVETPTVSEENALEKDVTIDLGNGVTMEFIYIDSGDFVMGSDEQIGDEDESPVRKINISEPFYMGKYEVTQKQWQEIMGSNNSAFKGEDNPVDSVSFVECEEFVKKLSNITGKNINIPTEAQWEYACRAGSSTKWFFGEEENEALEYAWIGDNANNETHPVGLKKPNKFGLYDMYGNIQEWCSDWYVNPYLKDDTIDPAGPESGDSKVIRGGAWGDFPDNARSAYRNANGRDICNDGTGLRVIMKI